MLLSSLLGDKNPRNLWQIQKCRPVCFGDQKNIPRPAAWRKRLQPHAHEQIGKIVTAHMRVGPKIEVKTRQARRENVRLAARRGVTSDLGVQTLRSLQYPEGMTRRIRRRIARSRARIFMEEQGARLAADQNEISEGDITNDPVCGDCGRLRSVHHTGDGCSTSDSGVKNAE